MLKSLLFFLYYTYLKTLKIEERPFHFSSQQVPFNLLKLSVEDALLVLPLFAFKKLPLLLPLSHRPSFLHYAACQLGYQTFFYSEKSLFHPCLQRKAGLFLVVYAQKKEASYLSHLGFSEFHLSLSYTKGRYLFSYRFPLPYSLAIFSYRAASGLLSP